MEFIAVKNKNSITVYSSGQKSKLTNGKWKHIKQTKDEEIQDCYQSLISDVKRQEFENMIKKVILSYLEWDEKHCNNIKILLSGEERKCEMNITVTEVWRKREIQLPWPTTKK